MSERDRLQRRVVFDCNIYLQSMVSPTGPSAACIEQVLLDHLTLYWSDAIIDEIKALPAHAQVYQRGVTDERVDRLIEQLWPMALRIHDVPSVFIHPIDPTDSHYIDLAVAANTNLIVSRDNHLLNLTNPAKPWSAEFRQRFPSLDILTPVALIARLRPNPLEPPSK